MLSPQAKIIYDRGVAAAGFDAMHFGPAHIVWEDHNLDDSYIRWCLDNARQYQHHLSEEQFQHVLTSLRELLLVPENERESCSWCHGTGEVCGGCGSSPDDCECDWVGEYSHCPKCQ